MASTLATCPRCGGPLAQGSRRCQPCRDGPTTGRLHAEGCPYCGNPRPGRHQHTPGAMAAWCCVRAAIAKQRAA